MNLDDDEEVATEIIFADKVIKDKPARFWMHDAYENKNL
jgi:hypothetical protein